MTYQFQSILYRTAADTARAVATAYLTADGLNTVADIDEVLAGMTNEAMADEALYDYGLAEDPDGESSWMDRQGVTYSDIVAGFQWARENASALLGA